MAIIQKLTMIIRPPFWLVLVVGNQAVTRGKNKLTHLHYTSDHQYVYRF